MLILDVILTISYPILLLVTFSILVRQVVIFSGQQWIKTFSHTMTLILIPIITYTITSVISGNIALSLGMVGALSIVRFRNPVKSPFELAIYFLMITSGIAASVSIVWLVFLMLTVNFVMFVGEIINRIYIKRNNRPLYPASFSEGNALSVLDVQAVDNILQLENDPELIAYSVTAGVKRYRLASNNSKKLLMLAKSIEDIKSIETVDFRAG